MRVLIAGPSASGKSSVATAVAKAIGVPVLSLDSFWIRGAVRMVSSNGRDVRTFEHPDLYDGRAMADRLAKMPGGFVAEGFCLFHYPEIMALGGSRFFIEVPFDECLRRRLARKPRRPSDRSFTLIGASETTKWVAPQKQLPGVEVVDGTAPEDAVCAEIVARLSVSPARSTSSLPSLTTSATSAR